MNWWRVAISPPPGRAHILAPIPRGIPIVTFILWDEIPVEERNGIVARRGDGVSEQGNLFVHLSTDVYVRAALKAVRRKLLTAPEDEWLQSAARRLAEALESR